MMTKKCQVVMLPTEKASRLGKSGYGKLRYEEDPYGMLPGFIYHHLYFISDDEIKEGDWVYDTIQDWEEGSRIIEKATHDVYLNPKAGYKKIVATTNPDLWKDWDVIRDWDKREWDNVPKIPTDFIEAYVREQGKIKEVMLECDMGDYGEPTGPRYFLKLRSNGTVIIHKVQEKKYNYDDLIQIRNKALGHGANDTFSEWFKQNYPE